MQRFDLFQPAGGPSLRPEKNTAGIFASSVYTALYSQE